MASELSADQEAVLSLVLKRRRSYSAVAGMLAIDAEAVRGRAQRAITALAGDPPRGLDPADAELIGDYLLGQLDEGERIEALEIFLESAPARQWGNRLTDVLQSRAADTLPSIPDAGADDDAEAWPEPEAPAPEPPAAERPRRPRPRTGERPRSEGAGAERGRPSEERPRRERPRRARGPEPAAEPESEAPARPARRAKPEPEPAAERPRRRRPAPERAPAPADAADDRYDDEPEPPDSGDAYGDSDEAALSRRGAGVLLIAGVLVIVAVIVFVTSGGGTKTPPKGPIPLSAATTTSADTTSTTAGTTGTSTNANVLDSIKLSAGPDGSGASGEVAVVQSGSGEQLQIEGSGLPDAGTGTYVLWLYNSTKHTVAGLGTITSVKNGTLSPVGVTLPSSASGFNGVILSLETAKNPTKPTKIVLDGAGSTAL